MVETDLLVLMDSEADLPMVVDQALVVEEEEECLDHPEAAMAAASVVVTVGVAMEAVS